eukprot:scaffold10650_cov85-Skeletonema_dohrnii-CCMP3373.AAC.4
MVHMDNMMFQATNCGVSVDCCSLLSILTKSTDRFLDFACTSCLLMISALRSINDNTMTMAVITTNTRRRRTSLLSVAAVLLSSSDVASSSSSASSVTLQTVFDAIDANHDGVISEPEYSNAMSNFLSSSGGDAGGASAASLSGAPPLGLDSNPFAYQRKKADNNNDSNNNNNSNSDNDRAKFDNPKNAKDFLKGLFASFSAIIATEIGDKTFFIAAILSMKNDRMAVFGGAILALIIMTILSTMM